MNETYYVKTEEKQHTVKIQNKDEKFYAYDAELVEDPTGTLVEKTITENGEYLPSDDDADGYSKVMVNVQGGGEQPILYSPIITGATNSVSWTNDTRNGGFAVTLSATIDGVAVTSPLTITQAMDGKTLIVTASAENFQSSETEIVLAYIGPNTNVIASFPAIPDVGGVYRFRFVQNNGRTMWKIDNEYVPRSNEAHTFDITTPFDFEISNGGTFTFTRLITATSDPRDYPLSFSDVGYYLNGIKVAWLKFTGTSTIMDADSNTEVISQSFTDAYGIPIQTSISKLNKKNIFILVNGAFTLEYINQS